MALPPESIDPAAVWGEGLYRIDGSGDVLSWDLELTDVLL